MRALQKGFTLIELMIVIAIIGILAALGIPAYQDYTARTQATECVTLTAGLRAGFDVDYNDVGGVPDATSSHAVTLDALAKTTKGKYISTVEYEKTKGNISCAYGSVAPTHAKLRKSTLVMNPTVKKGAANIVWACAGASDALDTTNYAHASGTDTNFASGTIAQKYVPSTCKSK